MALAKSSGSSWNSRPGESVVEGIASELFCYATLLYNMSRFFISAMNKINTGRAIIRVEYRGTDAVYPAVLLVREKNGLYSLPGGQMETYEKQAREAMIREVAEELHIRVQNSLFTKPHHVLAWASTKYHHDIFEVIASGNLRIDPRELTGIGFLNTGRKNQIPKELLAGHVKALIDSGLVENRQKHGLSPLTIPREYFRPVKNSPVESWEVQKKKFG
ncbi:hypothetical protein COW46_01765 [Candidatus Gracilibacteria bacterium CG17_big_fil_post_rev_8_21_14_2_50_48_13]|nr:MAG: hypothetical protein COW46_01765 [Candidatus Gracilibacteria bacterium CG17_big_fil_post_rev_8_21_14_2_50_48_13]